MSGIKLENFVKNFIEFVVGMETDKHLPWTKKDVQFLPMIDIIFLLKIPQSLEIVFFTDCQILNGRQNVIYVHVCSALHFFKRQFCWILDKIVGEDGVERIRFGFKVMEQKLLVTENPECSKLDIGLGAINCWKIKNIREGLSV